MKLKLKAWIKSDKLILNVSGLIVLAAFNVLSGAPTSKQMQVKSMGPLDFFLYGLPVRSVKKTQCNIIYYKFRVTYKQ